MRTIIPFLLTSVLFAGCVSTEATMLSSAPSDRPAVDTSEVAVYADTSNVECPYDPVAMISASGSMSSISNTRMVRNAKLRAAKVRANGVIIAGMNTEDPDYNPYAFGGTDYGSKQGRYLAVLERRPCGDE